MTDFSYFTSRLAPLASEEMQLRWGVRGKAESYVVASEILEGAHECVDKVRSNHPVAELLPAAVRSQVVALGEALEETPSVDVESLPWSELIETPIWRHLRELAARTLMVANFDLHQWEVANA